MIHSLRLRNRTREKGWSDDLLPSRMLEELCPAPSVPWDCGERYFHCDLLHLSVSELRGEQARVRLLFLLAQESDRLQWHTERLEAVGAELARRGVRE